MELLGDLSINAGSTATTGSAEGGNLGVDRGSVLPMNIRKNVPSLVRQFSSTTQGKGSSKNSTKEIKSAGLVKLEQLIKDNKDPNFMNWDIMSLVKDPDILTLAYWKIKSKTGNMTKGIDDTTLDGMSSALIADLSRSLGSGALKFSPARRVEIPKKKGGTRPLNVGNPRDKIVQEAMRMVLNAIFDQHMSKFSHGFRDGKSCLTAV